MQISKLADAPASARIQALYVKPAHGVAGVALGPADALHCWTGIGIDGDIHAHRLSPRQVLVTLDSELAALGIDRGALGENIVLRCDRPQLFRPGTALLGPGGVEIRLTMFCEPCRRIAHIAPHLARLRHRRGILGVVQAGGVLRLGDPIELLPDRYAPLAESAYQKFLDFLPSVPPGTVVRYADIALAIGADASFVRALPGYIKRSGGRGLPLHRIVNARGALLPFIPGQAIRLHAEGVIDHAAVAEVNLRRYLWQGS